MGSRQKVDTLSGSIEISINNVPVKQTSTVKSLTVLIDERGKATLTNYLTRLPLHGIGINMNTRSLLYLFILNNNVMILWNATITTDKYIPHTTGRKL